MKSVLDTIRSLSSSYDYVLFAESRDSVVLCSSSDIVARFKSLGHRMVVSGEVNLWPNPDFVSHMPPSSKTGHYKYPNSGGYMAEIPYLIELFDKMAIEWKSDCVDDQGELIKMIAREHNAFVIDHEAVLFQTLFGMCVCD